MEFFKYCRCLGVIAVAFSHSAVAQNPDPNFDLSTLKTQVVIKASAEWVPIKNEVEIEKGSALDFSTLLGPREPVGKYGRVVVRGAHFEFEKRPGVPVRFYGVNLCSSANYLEPEVSERFVANLARMGYNALRLHHHDKGLVEGMKDSVTLNPKKLAQLDALIAACVKHGLYITTDMYVKRPVRFKELGIKEKGFATGWPYKELVLFHEGAQSNYFAFARAFLDHFNPLTGRRYAEEPAIAWISIVNEGNHGHHGASFFEKYPGGKEKWHAWLAGKKRQNPEIYGDIPFEFPKKTWIRDSKHKSAFSLFATDLEIAFDAKAKKFLREEMKCNAIVSSINGGRNPPCYQLARVGNFDYVDDHFYYDHPVFIKKRWSLPNRLRNVAPFMMKDSKKGADLGVRGNVFRRLLDRPYTVTEFNFAGPNEYRACGGLMMGALASLQDWDGLWRFAWSHGDAGILEPEKGKTRTFDLAVDTVNRLSERAMMCLYMRGDMPCLNKTLSWVLPESKIRAVTEFSPYSPPEWIGAAWWLKLGTCVSEKPDDTAYRSVMYEDAYKLQRKSIVEGLPCGGGAVAINEEQGVFAVKTDRTCGAFALKGMVNTGNLTVDFGESAGTVWASSLDGNSLSNSDKILVTHLTDLKNTGMAFGNAEKTILLDWGTIPVLARVAEAKVSLGVKNGSWNIHRLDFAGKRTGKVAGEVKLGKLGFTVSTAPCNGEVVMCYELERMKK